MGGVISKRKEGIVSGQVTFSQGEEQGLILRIISSFRDDGEAHVTDYLIDDADQKIPDSPHFWGRLKLQLGLGIKPQFGHLA